MEVTDRLNRFRASYSVLALWESGQWQKAIESYLKLPTPTSQPMEFGKKLHSEWEQHIKKTKTLPVVFNSTPLVEPRSELKMVIPVADWLDFVCIPDCVDNDTLYEFKTGASDATYWANTWQTPIYGYALLANKTPVTKAKIYAYNQYTQKTTMALVWLTPELMQEAVDKMWTLSSEMWDYIQENKEQLQNLIIS